MIRKYSFQTRRNAVAAWIAMALCACAIACTDTDDSGTLSENVSGLYADCGTSCVNLALRKPASVSSLYSALYPPSAAVDGNTSIGSGSISNPAVGAWWMVDLGATSSVKSVTIYGRADCCSEQSSNLNVGYSLDGVNFTRIFISGATAGGRTVSIAKEARYIGVETTTNNYLSLQEVVVTGKVNDTTRPTVIATTPAAGAGNVSRTAPITATFSEPMNSTTINSTTVTIKPAFPGTVSYDSTTRQAKFTPSGSLVEATTYTVTLTSGAKDLAGNSFLGGSITFTTGVTAPRVDVGPADAMSVFIKSIEPFSSGNSGFPYFIVVNVDPVKIGQYNVRASDPYWLKYLCSMWKNGQFASAYVPVDGNPAGPGYWANTYFNSKTDYIHNPYHDAIFGDRNGYERILGFNWVANGIYGTSGYEPPHYRKNLTVSPTLSFTPIATVTLNGDKTGVYEPYPYTNGVYDIYMQMRIYTGTESVVAGEVTASGWGLIPMSATYANAGGFNVPYSPWVIVKPYDKQLSATQQTGKAWFKISNGDNIAPLKFNNTTATTLDAFFAAMTSSYINFDASGAANAAFGADPSVASLSSGGFLNPDWQYNGRYFVLTATYANGVLVGNVKERTMTEAGAVLSTYRLLDVNGSGNSLSDATRNGFELSASLNGYPVVLVFMSQGFLYPLADTTAISNSISGLVTHVTSQGASVVTVAHSWGGPIVATTLGANPLVNMFLVNSAQGPWNGGQVTFNSNIANASAAVTLVNGNRDLIGGLFGGGTSSAIAAVSSNPEGRAVTFPGGHSFADMVTGLAPLVNSQLPFPQDLD